MCLQYTNSLSPKLRSSRWPFQLQIVKKKKCFNSNDRSPGQALIYKVFKVELNGLQLLAEWSSGGRLSFLAERYNSPAFPAPLPHL